MIKKVAKCFLIMVILSSVLLQTTAFAFNQNNAKTYANLYADVANSAEYNVYGADCTNFVSQIMYAGGMHTDSTWYSNVSWHGNNFVRTDSVAWKNADTFKNYIKSKNGVTKIGQWSKYAMTVPYTTYGYVNNSSNLTSTNAGRVVMFYDWNADNNMDHITAAIKNGHSNILDSKPPCSPQMRQPQGMAPIPPAIGSAGYFIGVLWPE